MYKQLQELVNLKSETIHLSGDTKVFKETTIIFSSKLVEQEKHISWLATSFEEPGEKWVSAIDLSSKFTHPKCKLKQTLQKYLQTSKLKYQRRDYSWNKTILYYTKPNFFFLSEKHWPTEMDTSQNIWKFHTCITVHKTTDTPDPRRWHSTSISEIVGCHQMPVLQISFNKQLMDNIKPTPRKWL